MKLHGARILLGMVLLPALVSAQVRISRVSEIENPGVHHVDVDGRVLNARGMALAGVRVLLVSGTYYLYRETRTDLTGRFSFPDVSNTAGLEGMVDPPPEWTPAKFVVTAASGGDYHLGDIRLAANTTVRIALETAPGRLFDGDPTSVRLNLYPKGGYFPEALTEYASGVFTIDHIPYRKAELAITIPPGKTYTTMLEFEPGRRDRFLVARIPSGAADAGGQQSDKLEIIEMVRPPGPRIARNIEGVLRAGDGSPLEGAIVAAEFHGDRTAPSAYAVTGPDGRYRLQAPEPRTSYIWVDLVADGARGIAENQRQGGEIPDAIPLDFSTDAPQTSAAAKLRVRWWHGGLGWQTVNRNRTWIVPPYPPQRDSDPPDDPDSASLVADLPGYFPIFARMELPKAGDGPPQPVVQRFHFKDSPVHTLQVRTPAGPLAGATVDVVRIEDLQTNRLWATYTTGADGTLRLAGAPEGIYEVFAYARGQSPGHAVWRAGVPLTVTLVPATARLEISGAVRGQQIRVNRAGGSQSVAVVSVEQAPVSISLAPGDYEVTTLNDSGRFAASARATVVGGRTNHVDLSGDRPTELRVDFPGRQRWGVEARRVTARGDGTGEPAQNRNLFMPEELRDDEGFALLRLDGGGSYQVQVDVRNHGQSLQRAVEVPAGSRVVVRLPELNASLTGFVPPGQEVRLVDLWLRAADPDGWDVRTSSEDFGPDGQFSLDHLPAGRYYAWLHLFTWDFEKEPAIMHDLCAQHGWSFIPLLLEAGRSASLNDPAARPIANLKLRVMEADGKPVAHAVLFAHDPAMGDLNISFSPDPPTAELVNGAAELRGIAAGRLACDLLSDTGRVYSLLADVEPGRTLEIRLPKEGR